MIAALLSLALLVGAYDGAVESVDSSPVPALIELDADLELDEAILSPAVAPARAAVDRLVAAHHDAPGPNRALPGVFRPPRS